MPTETSQPQQPIAARSGDLDLFAFAMLLLRNLRFILGCGGVLLLLMIVFMLRAKPRYAATAVMIVPQQTSSAASFLQSQIAFSTMDLLGGAYELYVDILKSRTVADAVIKNHDLINVYGAKHLDTAESILGSRTKILSTHEGMIHVTVEDTSPQRAADIANDYLRQLDQLNSSLVLSTAGQKRAFLEREMVKEKNSLADAEVALKEIQETTSGLPPEAAMTASVSALQQTRAQLRADQIYLAALLTGATEENPDVVRVRSQIAGLSSQLEALQSGTNSSAYGTPTSKVPQQTLEYARRLRDVKFHEALYELMQKQFDAAKAQEAETPSVVEVLDVAVPPEKKSWPPRLYYCLFAAVVGVLLGIFIVSLRALVRAFFGAPHNQPKVQELKATYGSILPWKG